MRVYIGQYGYVWSLSPDEWMDLCGEAAETGSNDLTSCKMLKKRPHCVLKWGDADGSEFTAADDKTLYREPLDWWPNDFRTELEDFPDDLDRVRKTRR
jgi:hypothetical protein